MSLLLGIISLLGVAVGMFHWAQIAAEVNDVDGDPPDPPVGV